MFGKSSWFKTVPGGLGLLPICWQGWLYFFTWGGVMLTPAAALAWSAKPLEAAIWLVFSGVMLIRDARQLAHRRRRDELFVIDEDTDVTKISTSNFDLELRR